MFNCASERRTLVQVSEQVSGVEVSLFQTNKKLSPVLPCTTCEYKYMCLLRLKLSITLA